MTREELANTLTALHQTLSDTTDVDDETRTLLLSITADIERVLQKDVGTGDGPDKEESVSGRLQDMVVEFEARHPQIGGLLERLSDGLANMGI